MPDVLAIDIGGTKIALACMNEAGELHDSYTLPTPADGNALLETVIEQALPLVQRFAPAAIGVATAGQVNTRDGSIHFSTANLRDWTGTPVASILREAFGIPVAVDNDVNAMARAEAEGLSNALFVAVGTGLGAAMVIDGKVLHGASWTAGDLCHLPVNIDDDRRCSCGQNGHLEAYTSGPALEAEYARRSGEALRLPAIHERAEQGDAVADEVIREGARMLGIGLAGALNLLDPEVLILAGGVTELGPRWWETLEHELRANPVPGPAAIDLRRSRFGTHAVLAGAGRLARDIGVPHFDLAQMTEAIRQGLIVSCQALPDEPLHSPSIMARMAIAAAQSGAVAIRANGAADVRAIKQAVNLPVIGLFKEQVDEVHITPTLAHARVLAEAGADIIALDGTPRSRGGESLTDMVHGIHEQLHLPVMADVSTFEEGEAAAAMGADWVGTTLSGYTPYSPKQAEPDLDLVRRLSAKLSVPVIAEGRIATPEQAVAALDAGAHAVVVGGAITRPQQIAATFSAAVRAWKR